MLCLSFSSKLYAAVQMMTTWVYARGTKRRETHPVLDSEATNGVYLPARGRLPWFAFFMRSFLSLRRRVLAMMPPEPGRRFFRLCVTSGDSFDAVSSRFATKKEG